MASKELICQLSGKKGIGQDPRVRILRIEETREKRGPGGEEGIDNSYRENKRIHHKVKVREQIRGPRTSQSKTRLAYHGTFVWVLAALEG